MRDASCTLSDSNSDQQTESSWYLAVVDKRFINDEASIPIARNRYKYCVGKNLGLVYFLIPIIDEPRKHHCTHMQYKSTYM